MATKAMNIGEPEDAARPAPGITATFSDAIGDYAAVLRGQIGVASEISHGVAMNWVEGAGELSAAVDALRDEARALSGEAHGTRDTALLAAIDRFADLAQNRLLDLVAEGQRHDKASQILDALDGMVAAIGDLDLAALSASDEGAAHPRRLIEDAVDGFVMAEQRQAYAAAMGLDPAIGSDCDGACCAAELF